MPADRESRTPRAADDRVFREGRASDGAAIGEILTEADLSCQTAEKSPMETAASMGSTVVHVCERAGKVIGVVEWRNLGEEAEVLDVAVATKHRRQGNARFLLEKFLELIRRRGIRDVFLEVRESNAPAIALYRNLGFSASGRRPNYYQHPQEDALLLHLKIPD